MMKMPGMFSCREVHQLVATGDHEDLGFMMRLKLRLHVMMCVHCARYVAQLKTLGEQARRLLGRLPDPDRCRQLEERVMAHCDGHDH
jgi:hypothetical protein